MVVGLEITVDCEFAPENPTEAVSVFRTLLVRLLVNEPAAATNFLTRRSIPLLNDSVAVTGFFTFFV